jgi:hypothetical protein
LEDKPDVFARAIYRVSAELHLTVRLSIKASKQSQQCAFATAAGAYDG